ncbi:uncharacterized protein VTP21DRAFT_5108 [Calcarisporiella thermophila]|uniref:uncharacterized protein n=1 Tax=Calcarisporiella thermophila TaxID=911321 RepID=UPI003744354C
MMYYYILVYGSQFPGLKRIEFWGIPFRYLSPTQKEEIYRLCHPYHTIPSPTLPHSKDSKDIDNRYFDPITDEIMLDPVELPSGKIIDRSTLLRHLQKYSTDPFTGLPLSADQVHSCPKLKSEISAWRLRVGYFEDGVFPYSDGGAFGK